MKHLTAALLLALALPAAHAATVEVKFVDVDRYSDAGFNGVERERNTQALQRHLQRLGAQLPAADRLTIEVLDLDLAGMPKPASGRELHVLRGAADWPRIKLRYSLEGPGHAPVSGEETVSDLDYQQHHPRLPDGGALHYEKRMLEDWFAQRFATPQPQ